ncbi:MAG TPA: hypothetical protein VMM78_17550, partial [Thermomicrobiales bacterium]|nr:hypothetical protein [Thermomicrobiales bacterium]
RDIASLLEQAPSLKALVTSRVRLRLRGEREYPVPPLAIADDAEPGTVADAVALFVARSRAVQRQFQLTHEKAVTVDAICRRLAGLPLAIELAAARSRLLTPEAILSRLKRPLELLASGPLDLPARQQTIRATIQWSVDLLDAGAQQFFTRLSVFAGGWTLDAAEAVASVPVASPDTLGDLESLVDQNLITQLVHPDGEVRFGMLETIREFGMERLADSGEEATIRDRHAAWVVRLAEQAESHLEGSDQAAWLKRMEREVDNIRAALAWLREQGNAEPALRLVSVLRLTWASRGRLQEGYEQAVAVADLPHSAFYPALRADALIAASFLARAAGDFERAYDATRASLAISHQIRDRKRAADGLVNLGHIALQRGKIDDARALLQRSLTTNRELRNEQGIADTLGFLALTDIQTGDLDTAAQRLEQCVAIWDGLDDLQGVAWARGQLGLVRLEQAEYHAAWDNLMASLVISEALDFRSEIYPVFDGLARLASNYGQWDLAAQLAAASATVREESGIRLSPAEQARVDQLHGELLTLLGHAALNDIWSQRRGWTLTVMTGRIRETLAPLLAVLSSNGSPVMQPGGHAHPPVREDEPTD